MTDRASLELLSLMVVGLGVAMRRWGMAKASRGESSWYGWAMVMGFPVVLLGALSFLALAFGRC